MKKFALFLSCSIFAASAAIALNNMEHLNAVKDIFSREFEKIDTDKDGVISSDEYMLFQLEALQKSLAEEAGKLGSVGEVKNVETTVKNEPTAEKPVEEKKDLSSMEDTMATLQDMANFELPADEATVENSDDEDWYLKPQKLTKEDVMPQDISAETTADVSEVDLSVSEEDSLKSILENMMKEENEPQETEEQEAERVQKEKKQIDFMMNTIKKTLPKKIDNITTWTDIITNDNAIDYIYQADVDINKFSDAEKNALTENIEKVACMQAYAEMCAKIKPMFIDKGINMKIRYQDKNNAEISSCEFNNETCK